MNNDESSILREHLPVMLTQLVLCALLLGVYALLGRMGLPVILGVLTGTATSVLNYVAMIFSLLRAAQSDSPQKGQLQAQGNYMLRMIAVFGVLVVAIRFGKTDPFATLLPVVLMRVALFVGGLLIKRKGKGDNAE